MSQKNGLGLYLGISDDVYTMKTDCNSVIITNINLSTALNTERT